MLIFGVAAITVRSNDVIIESGVRESLCVFCETSAFHFYPWILLALHPNADLMSAALLSFSSNRCARNDSAGLRLEHRLNDGSFYWLRTAQESI